MDGIGFRRLMGCFGTGIAVVTTAVDGKLHGVTVNSFGSVSLEPPLVLVCIDRTAHAHEQIGLAGRFGVSILGEAQESVSRIFAAKAEPEGGRLRGVPFRFGPFGTPVLEGCLAWVECALSARFPGGDHTIFVGSVAEGGVESVEERPLLFFRGGYRRLAP